MTMNLHGTYQSVSYVISQLRATRGESVANCVFALSSKLLLISQLCYHVYSRLVDRCCYSMLFEACQNRKLRMVKAA